MHKELQKLINNERKARRELLDLRNLLTKHKQLKNPDPKLIKMIEDEIKAYQDGTKEPA